MTIHDEDELIGKIIDRFAQSPRFKEEGVDAFIASVMRSCWGGTTEFAHWHFLWSGKGLQIFHLVNGEWKCHKFTPKQVKDRLLSPKQLSFFDI